MSNFKQAFKMGFLTFFIAILVTLLSSGLSEFVALYGAILILLVVVTVGVVFDLIGVAATAAIMPPLNAKAAKKVFGARKALFLVKRADEVASFCCDIVGDICGTVSGALAAVIVLRIAKYGFVLNKNFLEIGVLALVASLTVGGKAYGKIIGITRANDIMFFIGKMLASLDLLLDFNKRKEGGGEKKWIGWKKSTTQKTSKS